MQAHAPESYGAIKAALIHYAKGQARQCAAQRIRVNTVSPGAVLAEGGSWHSIQVNEPERFKQIAARNPLGRLATLQEVANAVVFLASPASSFTTGINMIVDGGMIARVNY